MTSQVSAEPPATLSPVNTAEMQRARAAATSRAKVRARFTPVFREIKAPAAFLHKTTPNGVTLTRGKLTAEQQSLRKRFLNLLSFRQIEIAALTLDGWTQSEIAAHLGLYQTTVSRELQKVREACARVGAKFPEPQTLDSQHTVQISDRMRLLI